MSTLQKTAASQEMKEVISPSDPTTAKIILNHKHKFISNPENKLIHFNRLKTSSKAFRKFTVFPLLLS